MVMATAAAVAALAQTPAPARSPSPAEWTLIVSSQAAQATDDVPTRIGQWEAFVYAPDNDVLRAPMRVESLPYSMEQLTYGFTALTGTSGTLRLMWDAVMASVAFTVGL
jgi:hypothetical protein